MGLYSGNTATDNTFLISPDQLVADPSTNASLSWTPESWDVTSLLAPYAGQPVTLDLRVEAFVDAFGSTANVNVAGGFDDVAATFAGVPPTPEPSTWLMLAGALLLMAVGKQCAENRRARVTKSRASGLATAAPLVPSR